VSQYDQEGTRMRQRQFPIAPAPNLGVKLIPPPKYRRQNGPKTSPTDTVSDAHWPQGGHGHDVTAAPRRAVQLTCNGRADFGA
jgi:hypothetical protein